MCASPRAATIPGMTSPAIETRGLGKAFGARTALAGVDLAVPRGVAFGFLGANGAGKTTLIRLLLGLARPTAGAISILGHAARRPRAALARVGAIIEEPRFHAHLTGAREPARPRRGARPRRARADRRRARARRAGRAAPTTR